MHVLIVEDEKKMAGLLKKGLEEENHTVSLAFNGLDALEMALDLEYDAIVLDLMLPGIDGFEVARRLESWGMLEQARGFAERGVSKAGADLLAEGEQQNGARIYVRIMTRLRQHEAAYAVLQKALEDSAANLPVLKEQVAKQGFSGITDAQWRENVRRNRIETARNGMEACLSEMGAAVNTYFTPEERLGFAQFAESKHRIMLADDAEKFAIPLAVSANLADQEARWRLESLMRRATWPNQYPNIQPFVDLQRRRGRFAELGSQMEQLAAATASMQRISELEVAADAYRSAGDEQSEMRPLSAVFHANMLDVNRQQRYFHLLLEKQPQELVRIAAVWNSPSSEPAADYAIEYGDAALAHAVVQARSKPRAPVWGSAYNALVGLYFSEPTPEVNNSFLAAIGDDPIGVRLARPVDRAKQLAGNTWFYYGSRYGEYAGISKLRNPDDFLPAILEESPASASGYLTLADYYAGEGDTKKAIADYDRTLELSPERPDIYDKLAVAYYRQGDRAALAQWKRAFAVLAKQLNSTRVPETFWRDFGRTCDQLRTRHLFEELKPDADAIVRTYLRHNGTWMSNAVIHSAYAAQPDAASATTWLLDVSSSAPDPARVLGDVADASWIPVAQRAPIYQRILELKEAAVGKLEGIERENAQQDLDSWQERWIQYLVRAKRYSEAAGAIATLSQETRESQKDSIVPLELETAAQLGTLDAKLAAYRTDPQSAPPDDLLRNAASLLFESGDKQSSRKILELVFAREIEDHRLVAANFLGLAEIRLASGDTPGALDLLHRLVVAVGNPFENLDPAAALLEKTGHYAEAIEFLDQLVKSAPWEPSYRLRLAKATLAASADKANATTALVEIAASSRTSYDLRLKASAAMAGQAHPDLGSGELNLLGGAGSIAASDADKFYYYVARIKAAQETSDTQAKVQLLSHCVIDFPRRDAARLPLFEASVDAHSDNYALSVIEPLFETQFLRNQSSTADTEEEEIASSGNEDVDALLDSNIRGAASAQLSRAQQAHVAETIADTMKRLERYNDALSYYQTARILQSSASARRALARTIVEMKSILKIQHENAAREPILHEALEQDRVVRPRVPARVASASKSALPKGGVKQ